MTLVCADTVLLKKTKTLALNSMTEDPPLFIVKLEKYSISWSVPNQSIRHLIMHTRGADIRYDFLMDHQKTLTKDQ